jgi:hypothetical protein
MAMAGNAVGSFLLGKEKREARLEDQKLKQQQLKIMVDSQKIKDAKEQRITDLLSFVLGPDLSGGEAPATGGQPATPQGGLQFGETFGAESSSATQPQPQQKRRLTDILAGDPLKAAILKAVTGVDFLGASNAQRQQVETLLNLQRFNRDASQGKWEKLSDGKGGTVDVWQPRFGGPAGGGAVGGYQPPKPDLRQFEQGGVTYEQPFNPYTNEPTAGASVKSEKKPMAGEVAGKMGMLQSGLNAITQVQQMLLPSGEPDGHTYKVLAQMEANLPWTTGRQAGALIDDALEGKLRIESGAAVPDQEVKRMAKRFKPSVTDQPALIKQKLARMETYLRGTIELLDPNKNYGKNIETFTAEDGKKYVVKPNNKLDEAKTAEYLKRANYDKAKARALAKSEGWEF